MVTMFYEKVSHIDKVGNSWKNIFVLLASFLINKERQAAFYPFNLLHYSKPN